MFLSKTSRNRQIFLAIIYFRYIYYLPDKLDCVRSVDLSSYLRYTKTGRFYEMEPFSKLNFMKINKKRARLNAKKDRTNEKI